MPEANVLIVVALPRLIHHTFLSNLTFLSKKRTRCGIRKCNASSSNSQRQPAHYSIHAHYRSSLLQFLDISVRVGTLQYLNNSFQNSCHQYVLLVNFWNVESEFPPPAVPLGSKASPCSLYRCRCHHDLCRVLS